MVKQLHSFSNPAAQEMWDKHSEALEARDRETDPVKQEALKEKSEHYQREAWNIENRSQGR